MPAVFQKTVEQDLHKPLKIQYCADTVFTKDNTGNLINVLLFEDGVPYNGGGTVSATAIRADGATESWAGTISGNTVSVALTRAALDVPGTLQVFIKVTAGTVETTVYAGVYNVVCTETPTVVAPVTPSDVAALIASIEAAIRNIPADWTSFLGTIAPTFDPAKADGYAAGDYVWYPGATDNVGTLYRFTSAHSGTWTGTDAVTVVIGNELNDTVRYTQQIHTDAEKTIARANIGAASSDGLYNLASQVSANTTDIDVIQRTIGSGLDPNNTVKSQLDGIKADIGTVPEGQNLQGEVSDLKSAIDGMKGPATSADVGKSLIVKTVADGKVTAWEYGETATGDPEPIDMESGGIDTSGSVVDPSNIIHSGGSYHKQYNILDGTHGVELVYSSISSSPPPELHFQGDPHPDYPGQVYSFDGTGGLVRIGLDNFYPLENGDSFVLTSNIKHRIFVYSGTPSNCVKLYDSTWKNGGETYNVTANGFMFVMFSDHGNDERESHDVYPISNVNATITLTEGKSTIIDECHYAIIPCTQGGKYTVNGQGNSQLRLWCFTDNNYNVLAVSDENAFSPVYLTAPANSAYLIINDLSDNTSYKGTKLFAQKTVSIVVGDLLTASTPPEFSIDTSSHDRHVRFSGVYYVGVGQKVCVFTTIKHRAYIYSDLYGNDCELITDSGWTQGDHVYDITVNGFVVVVFSIYGNDTHSGDEISLSGFDGAVEIIGSENKAIIPKTYKISTYNTGDFSGEGYQRGSDDLLLQYRRAIAEASPEIVFVQADTPYTDPNNTLTPETSVFGAFRHFYTKGNTEYNYKSFASDFAVYCLRQIQYNVANATHPWFLVGLIFMDGIPVVCANLHLDWQDVTRRRAQIAAAISYLSAYDNVIVGGDMNPSVRVNGEFPSGSDHEHNFTVYEEDYALWETAGYTVANGKYLGAWQTDLTYPDFETCGLYAAWDAIFVKNTMKVKNAGVTVKDYMNDHAIFWAEVQADSVKNSYTVITK